MTKGKWFLVGWMAHMVFMYILWYFFLWPTFTIRDLCQTTGYIDLSATDRIKCSVEVKEYKP